MKLDFRPPSIVPSPAAMVADPSMMDSFHDVQFGLNTLSLICSVAVRLSHPEYHLQSEPLLNRRKTAFIIYRLSPTKNGNPSAQPW